MKDKCNLEYDSPTYDLSECNKVICYPYHNSDKQSTIENVIRYMSNKYDLSARIREVLMLNFPKIFHEHGKLIVVKDSPSLYCCRDSNLREDEGYCQVIEEEYLNILKAAFPKDDKIYAMDFTRLTIIGNVDFKELSSNYTNVTINKIKDVILHSKYDNVSKILKLLNQKNENFQIEFIELINPISNELVVFGDRYDLYVSPWNLMRLGDYISGVKEYTAEEELKFYEEFDRKNLINKNIYFIKEFDRLFEDILMNYINNITNDKLETLVNIKNYVIENYIKVKYTTEYITLTKKIPKETEVRNRYGGYHYETIFQEEDYVKPVLKYSLQKEKILKIKKLLLTLVPMIIMDDIDYDKLQELQMNEYLDGLLDTIGLTKQVQVKLLKK